jgi:hypothetical protein
VPKKPADRVRPTLRECERGPDQGTNLVEVETAPAPTWTWQLLCCRSRSSFVTVAVQPLATPAGLLLCPEKLKLYGAASVHRRSRRGIVGEVRLRGHQVPQVRLDRRSFALSFVVANFGIAIAQDADDHGAINSSMR